ncbi:Hypothetical protein MVR_LOCUS243 [uncultured virus]|nr:Hypothetical protein MVR_LOCUS243 [uncultured virus]
MNPKAATSTSTSSFTNQFKLATVGNTNINDMFKPTSMINDLYGLDDDCDQLEYDQDDLISNIWNSDNASNPSKYTDQVGQHSYITSSQVNSFNRKRSQFNGKASKPRDHQHLVENDINDIQVPPIQDDRKQQLAKAKRQSNPNYNEITLPSERVANIGLDYNLDQIKKSFYLPFKKSHNPTPNKQLRAQLPLITTVNLPRDSRPRKLKLPHSLQETNIDSHTLPYKYDVLSHKSRPLIVPNESKFTSLEPHEYFGGAYSNNQDVGTLVPNDMRSLIKASDKTTVELKHYNNGLHNVGNLATQPTTRLVQTPQRSTYESNQHTSSINPVTNQSNQHTPVHYTLHDKTSVNTSEPTSIMPTTLPITIHPHPVIQGNINLNHTNKPIVSAAQSMTYSKLQSSNPKPTNTETLTNHHLAQVNTNSNTTASTLPSHITTNIDKAVPNSNSSTIMNSNNPTTCTSLDRELTYYKRLDNSNATRNTPAVTASQSSSSHSNHTLLNPKDATSNTSTNHTVQQSSTSHPSRSSIETREPAVPIRQLIHPNITTAPMYTTKDSRTNANDYTTRRTSQHANTTLPITTTTNQSQSLTHHSNTNTHDRTTHDYTSSVITNPMTTFAQESNHALKDDTASNQPILPVINPNYTTNATHTNHTNHNLNQTQSYQYQPTPVITSNSPANQHALQSQASIPKRSEHANTNSSTQTNTTPHNANSAITPITSASSHDATVTNTAIPNVQGTTRLDTIVIDGLHVSTGKHINANTNPTFISNSTQAKSTHLQSSDIPTTSKQLTSTNSKVPSISTNPVSHYNTTHAPLPTTTRDTTTSNQHQPYHINSNPTHATPQHQIKPTIKQLSLTPNSQGMLQLNTTQHATPQHMIRPTQRQQHNLNTHMPSINPSPIITNQIKPTVNTTIKQMTLITSPTGYLTLANHVPSKPQSISTTTREQLAKSTQPIINTTQVNNQRSQRHHLPSTSKYIDQESNVIQSSNRIDMLNDAMTNPDLISNSMVPSQLESKYTRQRFDPLAFENKFK